MTAVRDDGISAGVLARFPRTKSFDELLGLARAGDVDAFGVLFELCGRRAQRHLRGMLGVEEARDAANEVFLRALGGLSEFAGLGQPGFSGWLSGIAHNYAIDLLRAREREQERAKPGGLEVLLRDWEPEDERQAQVLREVESELDFKRMVDWLPEDQRYVLVLRYRQDLDVRRIARLFDRSEPAVRMLLLRGLRSLRRRHAAERCAGAGRRDRLPMTRRWIPRTQHGFSPLPRRYARPWAA